MLFNTYMQANFYFTETTIFSHLQNSLLPLSEKLEPLVLNICLSFKTYPMEHKEISKEFPHQFRPFSFYHPFLFFPSFSPSFFFLSPFFFFFPLNFVPHIFWLNFILLPRGEGGKWNLYTPAMTFKEILF